MRLTPVLALAILAAGCRSTPVPMPTAAAPRTGQLDPASFIIELDRIAATELWPGFDLSSVPVAVFDGSRTLLFRHPSPPDGFVVAPEVSGTWIFPGRHRR